MVALVGIGQRGGQIGSQGLSAAMAATRARLQLQEQETSARVKLLNRLRTNSRHARILLLLLLQEKAAVHARIGRAGLCVDFTCSSAPIAIILGLLLSSRYAA